MTEFEEFEVSTVGHQIAFDLPPMLNSYPKAIQTVSPKVQQRRAKDAWNAAIRFRLLIWLWLRFLMVGMLKSRLSEETAAEIIVRIPELEPMGGILNMLAHVAERTPEARQANFASDERRQVVRGPYLNAYSSRKMRLNFMPFNTGPIFEASGES